MALSAILSDQTTGAYHFTVLTTLGLACTPTVWAPGLKELARQTEIGISALSAIGMVAALFEKPAIDQPKGTIATCARVNAVALGVLILVDTANTTGVISLSKYAFSLFGRELTGELLGAAITASVALLYALDLLSAIQKEKPSYAAYGNDGFKLLEIVAVTCLPADKVASGVPRALSALFGLARVA